MVVAVVVVIWGIEFTGSSRIYAFLFWFVIVVIVVCPYVDISILMLFTAKSGYDVTNLKEIDKVNERW